MIVELFSERKRKAAAEGAPDVYQYGDAPKKLRVQVQQILRAAIGRYYVRGAYDYSTPPHNNEAWDNIHSILCRELGVHKLAAGYSADEEVIGFVGASGFDNFIDTVEVSVRYLERVLGDLGDAARAHKGISQKSEHAVAEINYRFRQAGVGFQFINGEAIRVDSDFTHAEVIKPTLALLSSPGFEGPQEEFLAAHRHYRNGDFEETVTSAAKAFESTLKAVCTQHRWGFEPGDRVTDLLKIVRNHRLWPDYLDQSFDQLVATLSSGLPKVRNFAGAHGQGPDPRLTPAFIAEYALNLAASKIRFVAAASQDRLGR
jgi:hypothetical protein